ncbi:MAG: hypothetical protein ACI4SL_11455 [Candidatus Ornithospirochaeta sp.]
MDEYNDDIVLKVIETYGETDSIGKTASICKLSTVKVRKILITHEMWSSETSDYIKNFLALGRTKKEIANILGISEATVSAYCPYDKGMYKTGNPSKDAERSELYRKKIASAKERQVEVRKKSKDYVSIVGDITPYVVRLSIDLDPFTEEQSRILREYGESSDGCHFYRDILVPGDITINAMHYVIQKAFGWTNSHMRNFSLPEDRFFELTGSSFKGYRELCGILFFYESEESNYLYWNDDYEGCESFDTWIRRKYKGPYVYGGKAEFPEEQRFIIDNYIAGRKKEMMELKFDENEPVPFLGLMPLNELCSRLPLSSVLLKKGEKLPDRKTFIDSIRYDNPRMPSIIPCTDRVIYEYDSGDGWEIEITRNDSYDITDRQFRTVVEEHRPICLKRDGIMLLDDVGGTGGYIDFLASVFEGKESHSFDYGRDPESDYAWAHSCFGWKKKAPSLLNLL